jgi:hypothetical protein
VDNVGFVIMGYALTIALLAAYTTRLFVRAANAKRRADRLAARARPRPT